MRPATRSHTSAHAGQRSARHPLAGRARRGPRRSTACGPVPVHQSSGRLAAQTRSRPCRNPLMTPSLVPDASSRREERRPPRTANTSRPHRLAHSAPLGWHMLTKRCQHGARRARTTRRPACRRSCRRSTWSTPATWTSWSRPCTSMRSSRVGSAWHGAGAAERRSKRCSSRPWAGYVTTAHTVGVCRPHTAHAERHHKWTAMGRVRQANRRFVVY